MRILLLRPRPHRRTIGLQSVMICEPLELMQLSAVLQANGHIVTIVDMIVERKPLSCFLRSFAPDLVGITGYISHIGVMKGYARTIKRHNPAVLVAVGGVHAAVCPADFTDPHIDYICQSARQLYEVTGCTDPSERLPDRALPERYARKYNYLFAKRCALIKMSQGCPYNCRFCFCKEISPYIARDLDDCIAELQQIPQTEVYIVDDDFLFNRHRLLAFCDKVEQHQLKKRFLVYGRADFIAANEDVIAKLAAIGLSGVIVGIEAASQDELDDYQKRSSLSDNERAVRVLQAHRIECYATLILGVDWDKQDFRRLRDYIKHLGLVFVNLQPFTPMPGTPYFEQYREALLIPYEQHEKWDMAHLVVRPGKLSVRQYYWQIIKLYYQSTLTPAHVRYMFRRYGVKHTLQLSVGAAHITWQYLKKAIRGT
ncbi:MAG: cobalamin-dependent protein [Eubacteriales bacterium]